MTLKELKEKFAATAKAREEKKAQINALKAELDAVGADMLAAADQGDLEKYKKLDDQKRDLEARIFVGSRSLSAASAGASRNEIINTWEGFAASYEKATAAKYAEFMSDCKKLCAKYEALASIQNAALKEKEDALALMGESRDSEALRMYMIPSIDAEAGHAWRYSTAAIPFFVSIGCMDNEAAERISQIIDGGQAAEA